MKCGCGDVACFGLLLTTAEFPGSSRCGGFSCRCRDARSRGPSAPGESRTFVDYYPSPSLVGEYHGLVVDALQRRDIFSLRSKNEALVARSTPSGGSSKRLFLSLRKCPAMSSSRSHASLLVFDDHKS